MPYHQPSRTHHHADVSLKLASTDALRLQVSETAVELQRKLEEEEQVNGFS